MVEATAIGVNENRISLFGVSISDMPGIFVSPDGAHLQKQRDDNNQNDTTRFFFSTHDCFPLDYTLNNCTSIDDVVHVKTIGL